MFKHESERQQTVQRSSQRKQKDFYLRHGTVLWERDSVSLLKQVLVPQGIWSMREEHKPSVTIKGNWRVLWIYSKELHQRQNIAFFFSYIIILFVLCYFTIFSDFYVGNYRKLCAQGTASLNLKQKRVISIYYLKLACKTIYFGQANNGHIRTEWLHPRQLLYWDDKINTWPQSRSNARMQGRNRVHTRVFLDAT